MFIVSLHKDVNQIAKKNEASRRKDILTNKNRSVRIGVISDTAPPQSEGGIGSAHYNLYRALRSKGLNAELFLFFHRDSGRAAPDIPDEETIHRFGPPPWLRKLLLNLNKVVFQLIAPGQTAWNTVDIFISGLGIRRMNSTLRRFSPDLIIVPDHGAPGLWIHKPKRAVMHLISHHNPKRFSGEPLLGNNSQLDADLAVWLENKALRRVQKVSCPSRHMKMWFDKTYQFSGEVRVIPNLILKKEIQEIPAVDPRALLGQSTDSILIGIPSGQTAVKGSHLIAQIVRGIAEKVIEQIGFFLAGEVDPDLTVSLGQLPKNVTVHTPGRLSHDEFIASFKSCSFGIFPSLRDNYSMALLEAVVCGVPMIAFDTGGNADIIRHGENGLLFADISSQALIDASVALIRDAKALNSLREKTSQYADTHFDSDQIINQYIDYFLPNI